MFASLAQFERDIISERTISGLEAARARGRTGGRPKALSPESEDKARMAETLYKSREYSIAEILKQLKISKGAFYNYLKHRGVTLK